MKAIIKYISGITCGLLFLSAISFGQNNAPVLTEIGDQSTNEDNSLTGLIVNYTDIDVTDEHVINIVSSEPNVTVSNLSGNTNGSTYDLIPAADWYGTASITVTVTDNGVGTLSDFETYTLSVNSINDAPVISEIGDQFTDENIDLTGLSVVFDEYDVTDEHVINIVSSEPNVTVTNLSDHTSGSTYDLELSADWSGTAQITVTVTDNGIGNLSDSETYTLTVNAVSDAPTVVTHGPSDVYETIIAVFGEVSDEGSSPVTDRGMCLSLSPDPDLSDIVSHEGSGPGFFTSQFSYLMHSTTYYYCAFATNAEGTFYGEVLGVTTMSSSMTLTETISNVSCNGADDGSVDINVSGGLPPYTYSWSNGASTQNISSLAPGTYSVNVTDSEYDQIAGTYEVLEPAEIDLLTSVVNNVNTCNGDATGSIQLVISGGTPPYTIEWEHGPTVAYISDLPAGTYDVLVTDANYCEQMASYDIVEPDVLTANVVDITDESCIGCADGTIVAAASGGTGPYTFHLTGPDEYSSFQTIGIFTGLSAGEYFLDITDNNACTSEILQVTVGNPLTVTNTNDSGVGSLRDAINNANSRPGADIITFNIPGAGPHVIQPTSLYPTINEELEINGYSQPGAQQNTNPPGVGFNSILMIEIDGTFAGDPATGLIIMADNCTITGLVITRFSNRGIALWENESCNLIGNHIGADLDGSGTPGNGNGVFGIELWRSSYNTIRGNIISDNGGVELNTGISIHENCSDNLIAGNLIGTDITGTIALPNSGSGISMTDSPDNEIGRDNISDRNVILGGVSITGSNSIGNSISGNYLGPDISGLNHLGDGGGVSLYDGASNTEIGPNNVISGNQNNGVQISGQETTNNRIFGNIIGLNSNGDGPLSNHSTNVVIYQASNNRIGGLSADSSNVISASNIDHGIEIRGANATQNHIIGNYIGTNSAGDQGIGNARDGIIINDTASYNIIGPDNVISGNGSIGVYISYLSENNRITNNLLGTDYLGSGIVSNALDGIYINNASENEIDGNIICSAGNGWPDSGSGIVIIGNNSANNIISNNQIGSISGSDPGLGNGIHGIDVRGGANHTVIGPGNVIAGNMYDGIHLENANTTDSRIFENIIGTDALNTVGIGNGSMGIVLADFAGSTTIGPGNVVSGNGMVGIQIHQGSSDNTIIGNRVGTTIDGMGPLGNGGIGLMIDDSPNNVIGGTDPEDRNLLSGNGMEGITLAFASTSGNLVIGNYIGTDVTGNELLQNGSGDFGINGAPNNIIGGLNPGERNVIASMAIGNSGARWNRVSGNYFGLRADGQGPLSEEYYGAGVFIAETSDNIIGPENVFGGLDMGVFVHVPPGGESDSTVRNSIFGNFIGTNPDGTTAIPNRIGLQIEAKKNLIGGYTEEERNIISGNDIGVNIFGEVADSNIVVGNYIGTDYLGESAIPNNNGVWITDGNDNLIGGVTEEARNIISGNNDNGIWIQGNGPLIADGNKVQGNFIGLAANGTDPLGNGGFGVKINAAAGNLIGGPEPQHRNIISANGTPGMNRFGIYVEFENSGVGNIIQGNYVGTDVSGMLDVGNVSVGILINNASNIKILDNVVSGNAAGISLWQGEPVEPALNYENIISGNKVGLNADLSGLLGNDFQGISVYRSSNNVIGGTTLSEANIIGGNGGTGIMISHNATGNEVLGNYIGVDPTGTKAWPNEVGIQIDTFATNNQVGDLNGNGNFIAYNDSSGVLIGSGNNDLYGNEIWSNGTNGIQIYGDIGTESENNRLSQNLIYSNGLLGIDLNSDGVTENDLLPLDPDEGPNHLQNFPILDSVNFAEGNVTVEGHLWTKSDTIYVIEFFGSGVSDSTGFGEGEFYLGNDTVQTDETGYASFLRTLPTQGYGAQVITATATDLYGNTSEFSQIIGGEKDQVLAEMPFWYTLNNEGLPTVPLADYQEAIRSAFQTWDDIPIAEIEMEDAGESDQKYASATDGVNLVSFQDDRFPFAKGVLAVTAKTLRMSSGGTVAEIVDADIVFNPAYIYDEDRPFAVLEEGDTETEAFDIQTVATHEIGHVLGMIHSGVYSSTMFFMLGSGTTERELDADDMAWASFRYPMEDFQATHGLISGRITYGDIGNVADPSTHPPVAGALVLAIDTLTREMIHAYTDADGNYTVPIPLEGVGTARYWIYIQPLDGDVYGTALNPANISPYIYSHTMFTDFPEEFYDELESADDEPRNGVEIQVSAGSETSGIDLITNRDLTPPTVIGVSPALGDTGVAVSPTLAIKFSEPVDIYSFNDTTCYLESTGGMVGSEYTLLADSTHIVLMKPLESLLYSTEYTLHISEILDLKNNELATDYSSSFTTQAPDTLAPAVYDVIPADSTTQVDVTKPIKVFFSEPMTKTSVETAWTLMTVDSTLVTGNFDWDLANKEMTYSPDYSLEEGTEYMISLNTQALDLAGNAMEDDTTFRFFTVNVAKPQILYLGPDHGSSGITVETPVVVKFSEPMDLTSINAGSFSLSDTEGPVSGSYEYLDQDRTIVFRPDQSLIFDEDYTVNLTSNISDKSDPQQHLQDTTTTFRTAAEVLVPHIDYMDPPFGAVGAQVSIVGSGFDPVPLNNTVLFDGLAAHVSKATLESLTVNVPFEAVDGPVSISVNSVAADNSFEFDVVPPNTDPSYSVIASSKTGSKTRAVVINPDAGYAYVTNWGDNTVTPIDISGNIPEPGTDIPVGIEPMDIDLNPAGTLAYVTNYLSNTVSVIGTDSTNLDSIHRVVNEIQVGYHPYGVAASSDKKVYVANNESEYVSVIDVDSNSGGFDHVIANVKTGSKNRSIVVTPDAALILVTGEDGVKIIDRDPLSPEFNDVIASASKGSSTRHVTITPDAALALATTEDGVILIIDIYQPAGPQFGSVIASVKTGSSARNINISPDAMYVYITNPDENTVSVYQLDYSIVPGYGASLSNPQGLVHITTIAVDDAPYAIIGHPKNEYLLVTHDSDEGGVSKIAVKEAELDLIETLEELIVSVQDARNDRLIPFWLGNTLLYNLNQTKNRISLDLPLAAIFSLDKFIRKVQRNLKWGRIPTDLGEAWLETAYMIREQLLKDYQEKLSQLKGSGEAGSGAGSGAGALDDPQSISGNEKDPVVINSLKLENRPNPFSYHTQVLFEIPNNGEANVPVFIRVFNTSGQVIKTLVHMDMAPGQYTVHWDGHMEGGGLAPDGIYLLELMVPSQRKAIRISVVK